mmetsp:Transcript_88419/g.239681  ORF Transcript_88419/g.239681 Transcript_88419/m.239681 type:complete len:216 (-) Transcript_88419:118-765(-)
MVWSVSPPHGLPPPLAGTSTLRVRMVCPLSQVLSHSVHGVHSDSWQSAASSTRSAPASGAGESSCATSQGATCSSSWPQGLPPKAPGVTTSRERYFCVCLVLPPYMSLSTHLDHSDHSPSSQSRGSAAPSQGSELQGLVTCSGSAAPPEPLQGLPPYSACWATTRTRSCWPPSHLRLQPLHSIHAPSSQSTAACRSPHGRVDVSAPTQGLPPAAG